MNLPRFLESLHSNRYYRRVVVECRLWYFVRIRRRLRILNTENAFETTVSHNLKSLKLCSNRIELLIKPLSVIESLNENSQCLIIGPRNEHDLFCLIGNGFRKANVRGLDIISYSPMIDLGDMHKTEYASDTFDSVTVGWTLSYSRKPAQFAAEMVRIIKPGGILAIGVEYSTMTEDDEKALSGYSIQEITAVPTRINSVSDILNLFRQHLGDIFFTHDAPRRRSHSRDGQISDVSNAAVIFGIKK